MKDKEKYLVFVGMNHLYDYSFLIEAVSANDAAKIALNMMTVEKAKDVKEISAISVLDMTPLNLADVKDWVGLK